MKLAISVATSGRKYLSQFAESLSKAVPNECPMFVGCDESANPENVKVVVHKFFPKAIIQSLHQDRLFADAAIIQSRNLAFEKFNADEVLSLDDDILVSLRFLKTLLALRQWTSQWGDHVVQTGIDFRGELQLKKALAGAVGSGLGTGTNMLMSRNAWLAMRPILDTFAERWAGVPGFRYDLDGIRNWFKDLLKNAKQRLPGDESDMFQTAAYGVTSDSAVQVAAAVNGIRTARLCVNRAINIGEHGEHFNAERFKALDGITLDEVDETEPQFYWRPFETQYYYDNMDRIKNQTQRLTVVANIGGHAGYHFMVNEIITCLSRSGLYVNVRPSTVSEELGSKVPIEIKSRFVQRIQPEPWELIMHPPDHSVTPGKKTVFYTMWETTRLSKTGDATLRQAQAIIVPSSWNASCFSAQGFDVPIFVVPLGVNPDVFSFAPMKSDGPCVFGAAGRLAHGGSRKGLYEVIDAFQEAFKSVENVRLRIKCFTDCKVKKPDDSRIEIVTDFLSENGLANWLRGLTCFVSASRGEGWGLFPHQAMAVGRPVIGCHYGGMAEFMNAYNSYALAYSHEKATGFYENCGNWSEPDMSDLVRQMRFVFNNRQDALKRGIQAHLDVRHLTWDNTSKKMTDVLKKLGVIE